MDFKFKIKLENKLHKGAVHYPTAPAVSIALKNIYYRHYKTDNISLPYISESQIAELTELGYLDIVGAVIDGELLEPARLERVK